MSTKTLRKRIALVAVTALGAGLLSVVAVPSANATSDITDIRTGSVGLLAGTANASITGVTSTATVLSTGSLVISADDGYFTVSAGAVITGFVGTVNAVDIIDADQLGAILPAVSGTATGFIVKPTGAVGSTFTVTSFNEAGTVIAERITVTIAGTSVAGALSVANSTVTFQDTDGADGTTDDSGADKTTVGLPLFLNVQLKDAYKATITSITGALVVTVSAGAVVGLSANAGAVTDGATFTQAVSSASPADINIQVNEATVGAGWAGTITVAYNGVTVSTRTGTITGAPAKITLTNKKIGKTGSNAAALEYQVTDTAGNIVVLTQTNLVFSSSSNVAAVTGAVGDGVNSATAVGTAALTCTAAGGASNLVMQTTLSNASIVTSNSVAVRCGGAAASYTASFDKATYAQGEIATLTVAFKDATGLAANSYEQVSANTTADQVITVNQTERVTAHAAAAKLGAAGTLVYTFTVGTVAGAIPGKYQALVSFPHIATGSTQTVAYEISGGSAVSMADVLKAIVSLIASINKQIAALQKALLKK
jgi:hypothetical protein